MTKIIELLPSLLFSRGMNERCVVCAANRAPSVRCDHGQARVLGEGTYGQVFLCSLPDNSRFVEKVLKVDASITHQREISCLSQCRHPNIVRLLSACNTPISGRVTVRMEYCEDGDLYTYIQQRRAAGHLFSSKEVLHFMAQLLLAIHYLHAKSILHRDIKTSNIFLCHGKQMLKLGDFGCSLKSDMSIAEDQRRTLCGTWQNVAPEVLVVDQEQRAEYGKKAETWSAGIVMYELMTLTPPFSCNPSDAQSFQSMLNCIACGYVPAMDPSLGHSAELVSLCREMLTPDKRARPFVRGILQHPLMQSALAEWLAEATTVLSKDERIMIQEQLHSVQEPHGFSFMCKCNRVRSSTSDVIPAELGIKDAGGKLYFRDDTRRSDDWNTCSLVACSIEDDDFEEGDGKMFYGLCVRPCGFNPVTFGYFDKEQRDSLRHELLARMTGE
jgi:NIMA (never in mitosis gene a)-related kinase 1/4/5